MLERFVAINRATNTFGHSGAALWDDEDGFFYDTLVAEDGSAAQVRVRSLVGLLPLLAVASVPSWVDEDLPDFTARVTWLRRNVPDDAEPIMDFSSWGDTSMTLTLVHTDWYPRMLTRLLDESEFLSPYGIRSLSAAYRDGVTLDIAGTSMEIAYDPGESTSNLFGGNSNWRGPVWFPVNVLLADALDTYAEGAGAGLSVEFPTGSGRTISLKQVANAIDARLIALFRPGADGRRPSDPRDHGTGGLWADHPVFSEFFHGDTGIGLGASHQTGWTALVAHLICTRGEATPLD
jgi:hypothetical protein